MLAAANSVFGRWDDTKAEDNIDFMPTILSRFDMIFIVKDEHDQNRDIVSIKLLWSIIIYLLKKKFFSLYIVKENVNYIILITTNRTDCLFLIVMFGSNR